MKKYILFFMVFTLMAVASSNLYAESDLDFLLGKKNRYKKVFIKKVISADSIVLASGERIKLIGLRALDPPPSETNIERDKYNFEIKKELDPITPLDEQAFSFAKDLLENKYARLELDYETKDEEHNTLAYVFLLKENIFANTEILRQGFAHLRTSPLNKKYKQELRAAYKEARRELRGLQGQ